MDITIKEKARVMLESKLGENDFLRITITEGGCAGLTYGAEIASEMNDTEKVVLELGKVRIVANPDNEPYLNGLVVDYSDDLISGGLNFTNSNAKATCGCGASFNLSGFPVIESGKCGG